MLNMKRIVLSLILLFFSFLLFGQAFNYNPFFTVKIIDNEATEFLFSDMRYLDSNNELKYFFWIRRGSDLGTATYQIDFKKIKSIIFSGEYDDPVPGYTVADLTLTSGEVFEVLVNSSGIIGGMDNDFGVYGEIYMNYNIIKSIEFIHDGEFQECSFCGAVFYDSTYTECPFDKTELTTQNVKENSSAQ